MQFSRYSGFYIEKDHISQIFACITQIPGEYRINCISLVNSFNFQEASV